MEEKIRARIDAYIESIISKDTLTHEEYRFLQEHLYNLKVEKQGFGFPILQPHFPMFGCSPTGGDIA